MLLLESFLGLIELDVKVVPIAVLIVIEEGDVEETEELDKDGDEMEDAEEDEESEADFLLFLTSLVLGVGAGLVVFFLGLYL